MASSTILVLLTQGWIACCFRLEANVNGDSSYNDLALSKRHDPKPALAEDSGSSASSVSLQPRLHPSVDLEVSGANIGSASSTKEAEVASTANPTAEDAAPTAEGVKASTPDLNFVRKQVEYYLSDENLRYDKFFHEQISRDPEGWLEIKYILTCNLIKDTGATPEDILTALKESELEVKEGGAFLRRPGNAVLPKLEPKPDYHPQKPARMPNGGIISVFNNFPAKQNSLKLKDALKTALPLNARLLFISEVDDKRRCFCATAPFEGDVEFFASLVLFIGGTKVKSEFCQGDSLQVALKLLPNHILEGQQKETRKRQEERNKPIIVGTQRFLNVGALRSRVKEVIKSPIDGEHLKQIKPADVDPAKVLERMYAALYNEVARASQAVEHLNMTSAREEVTKRVAKYIYNSAKREELRSMEYEEACNELVNSAMGSYDLSFGEKGWFFKLDLAPAFAIAAWGLFRGHQGLRFEQVQAKTKAAFAEYLESAMLNKGMWEASANTFKDTAIHEKVYAAVQKTHRLALDATMMEIKPEEEFLQVQSFLKRWINDSMTRAWNSIPDPEKVLTVRNVNRLFQNMLAPFGCDNPYSTIPFAFTQRSGALPMLSTMVDNEVKALFNSWSQKMAVKRGRSVKASDHTKRQVLSVGDTGILKVSYGKWKGNHTIKLLEKREDGWKVSHDADGYECVIKRTDLESGKMAISKIVAGKSVEVQVVEKAASKQAPTEKIGRQKVRSAPEKTAAERVVAKKAPRKKVAAEEAAPPVAAAQASEAEPSTEGTAAEEVKSGFEEAPAGEEPAQESKPACCIS